MLLEGAADKKQQQNQHTQTDTGLMVSKGWTLVTEDYHRQSVCVTGWVAGSSGSWGGPGVWTPPFGPRHRLEPKAGPPPLHGDIIGRTPPFQKSCIRPEWTQALCFQHVFSKPYPCPHRTSGHVA